MVDSEQIIEDLIRTHDEIEVENGAVAKEDWDEFKAYFYDLSHDIESFADKLDDMTNEEAVAWLDEHKLAWRM